ncbi:MAG: hypothetical protein ACE5IC_03505 [Candidatus Brocadiales bacterium]
MFRTRPRKVLEIEKIRKDKTWLLGYLSKSKLDKDISRAESDGDEKRQKELLEIAEERECLLRVGEKNTNIYLTWDYMDVYIATSMRESWEFEACFDFVNTLFKNPKFKDLNLRYFDPTQSFTINRIDKGLIEGLMIKRAACTIYLAQETETLGKDSELAATLAQGKPVIAYIPRVVKKNLKKYPLKFFWKRFMILKIGEHLEDFDLQKLIAKKLGCKEEKVSTELEKVIEFLDDYVTKQTYYLYESKEQEKFLEDKEKLLSKMYDIFEICENYYMDKKEIELSERHPLGIQMALESGVANGVLVVRSIRTCAKLLFEILTNSTKFNIEHKEDVTRLVEITSRSPFRVVTGNTKLSNSFWNFYL